MINKDTQLCVSLAAWPSNFGTTVHNAGYRALGLNFIYKAFGIEDLEGALRGVRAFNIRGCSVSMPFKQAVIPLLDELDDAARKIGAVNTIVQQDGTLKGYNTDAFGAKAVLGFLDVNAKDRVLLLGAGGVAKAILYALEEGGIENIVIANRTEAKAREIAGQRFDVSAWEQRQRVEADVLINATCIGMNPESGQSPLDRKALERFKKVMDVVISPMESLLAREAKSLGKQTAEGYRMSLKQAVAQFELYTGQKAPEDVMEAAIRELLNTN